MKNAVFWDVAPCRYCVNQRFGETYRLHLQDRKPVSDEPTRAGGCSLQTSSLADFSTLKIEAIGSSEKWVHTRSTRRNIPEDGILHEYQNVSVFGFNQKSGFIVTRPTVTLWANICRVIVP
jgi:hypothetical protein